MAGKKTFTTAAAQVKAATGAADTIELTQRPQKGTTAKKKTAQTHINIALTEDQLTFLKAFCKIRGESYGETIGAMIDRAMRENSELVALVEKAKAAL